MTLFQRLVIMTLTVLFLALAGNISSGVWSVKEHLNRQLNINAEDAARSLAVSLNTIILASRSASDCDCEQDATAIDSLDKLLDGSLETLLNATFHGGDYKSIRVFSIDGRLLIEKKLDIRKEDGSQRVESLAPDWFKGIIKLTGRIGQDDVTDGWNQYGVIYVEPNTDASYNKLWQVTENMVIWVALLMSAVLVMIVFFMRALLKPLADMEHQANAISNRDFRTIPLPKARELRRVVMVMNGMAEKLSRLFSDQAEMTEQLREMSYRDSLTGLSNRRDFMAHFKSYLDPRQGSSSGALILVGVRAFEQYNQEKGTTEADELLVQLAAQMKEFRKEFPLVLTARLKGAEFGIFLPDVSRDHSFQALQKLFKQLSMVPAVSNDAYMADKLHIGLAYYSDNASDNGTEESVDMPSTGSLISLADQALRRAQGRGRNCVMMLATSDEKENESVMGDQAWRGYLEKVLERRAVKLLYQPVKHFAKSGTQDFEVLARTDYKDSLVTASLFWPMVERYQWTEHFDKLIITKAMTLLASQPLEQRLTLNVSPKSLMSDKFSDWLKATAKENPALSQRVVLEVSEYALHQDAETIIELSQTLNEYGMKMAIDHFGASSGTFSYLSRIKLSHLKVDRSYVRDIHLSKDNQFYIRSLLQIAHNLDIKVFAEGVEQEEEYQTLKELGVDGAIGYLFGKPLAEPH